MSNSSSTTAIYLAQRGMILCELQTYLKENINMVAVAKKYYFMNDAASSICIFHEQDTKNVLTHIRVPCFLRAHQEVLIWR